MKKKVLLLLSGALAAVCSCNTDDGPRRPVRSEYITVYETSPDKTVDAIQVPFEGVQNGQIHVLSNVPVQWKYFVDQSQTGTDWFKVKSVEEVESGHILVTYDAESILALNSLDRRSGRLSFSCPEESLGKFLIVKQGYSEQFYEDFSDQPDQTLVITGRKTFTTEEYPVLNADYCDYISFNAWAETANEFLSRNITLDVTVSGGKFYATGLTTYRVNVPIGTGPNKDNMRYLLLVGNGERMSAQTKFTFSTANDDQVYVHIDNFSAYRVTEAEMGLLITDEDFEDEGEVDWI
jgi:hypothetical protein